MPRSLAPAFATEAGTEVLPFSITARRLGGAVVCGAVVVGAVAVRGQAVGAAASLQDVHPVPLVLGGVGVVLTLAASAGAWRSALRSAGAHIRFTDAWGCYGLGSVANAVLPARLGEPVRIGLFASRIDDSEPRWLCAGACGAVAAARAMVYSLTCCAAAAVGILPVWTLAAPAGVVLVATVGGAACRPRLGRLRVGGMLTRARGSVLVGWAALAAGTRLLAATCVFAALDVPAPLRSALVGLVALAVAGALPVAPAGLGFAGAGMALALQQSGIPVATAVAAAVAFHAVETLATLGFGSSGWLALRISSVATARTCSRRRSGSG